MTDAHNRGKIWMQPVSVQDARPRSGIYAEANNSENLRATWNASINGNAEWVQLTTWNDYSEQTEFSPSSHIGWGPLDINTYYLQRFKTGSFPAISRDVLYLSHRVQPFAALPTGGQTMLMNLVGGSSPSRDTVEVLSFLTSPASVTLTAGTVSQTYTAPAGLFAQSYPLQVGQISAVINYADGTKKTVTSPFPVQARPAIQDLQYHFVSSAR